MTAGQLRSLLAASWGAISRDEINGWGRDGSSRNAEDGVNGELHLKEDAGDLESEKALREGSLTELVGDVGQGGNEKRRM